MDKANIQHGMGKAPNGYCDANISGGPYPACNEAPKQDKKRPSRLLTNKSIADALKVLKRFGVTVHAWDEKNGEDMPAALREMIEIAAIPLAKEELKRDQMRREWEQPKPSDAKDQIVKMLHGYDRDTVNLILGNVVEEIMIRIHQDTKRLYERIRQIDHERDALASALKSNDQSAEALKVSLAAGTAKKV